MKRTWFIVIAVVALGLVPAILWLRSIAQPPLSDIGPPPTGSFTAYCAKKIERVRVVHLIPGELNKPVTLGPLDPEFVRHAKKTLDQFWHREIIVVETNNGGTLYPVSEREMTLAFAQQLDGRWRAFALLYDEPHLMADLQSTASSDDSLVKSGRFETLPKKNWGGRYFNKAGNFWSVGYDEQSGEFLREGDGTGKSPVLPRLFVRSLQDIVAGRCDRPMSEAVHGPAAWKRPVTQIGEF